MFLSHMARRWLPKEAAEKMIPPGSSIEAEAKEGRVLLMEYTGVDAALSDLGEDAAVTIPDERFFCNPQVRLWRCVLSSFALVCVLPGAGRGLR